MPAEATITDKPRTLDDDALDLVIGDLEQDIPDLPSLTATHLNTTAGCATCTCASWYCV
jgi:hypothetical protein